MPRRTKQTLTLTRRADGRFCKKIGGVIHYFGRDEKEAEQQLLDLLRVAGHTQHRGPADAVTVQDVAEAFAAQCRQRVAAGTMRALTFEAYDSAIALFAHHVKPNTRVQVLRADQFAAPYISVTRRRRLKKPPRVTALANFKRAICWRLWLHDPPRLRLRAREDRSDHRSGEQDRSRFDFGCCFHLHPFSLAAIG